MRFEKSCGVVVYRGYGDTTEFLVVRNKEFGHWGFPKGHVEEKESEEETAKREVLEETGLNITLCRGFRTSINYLPEKDTSKEVVFFVGKYLGGNINIHPEEIQDYKWLNFSRTFKLLTFDTDKKVLSEVKDYII